MKVKKTVEIKARCDGRMKAELSRVAYARELDVSDILREAVRELLRREREAATQQTYVK